MKRAVWVLVLAVCGWADEGMWLFNQFPKEQVEKKYGFQASEEFLNHLRLASVRLGASGSFVSPQGLIFTNHHVASGCIQKVSTKEHNYMADGFYAATQAGELKCPDSEANVLLRIEDVTQEVNAGVTAQAGTPEANRERLATRARIEKECGAKTGNRCEVATLYAGASYSLYEYKKYTDVRLVFAPEEAMAFFGGDPDNFTYPRYDLDIAFMRAYEDGRPAETPHYLKWSREGVREGELVLVSGNPASTDRFITYAELEYQRDTEYPLALGYVQSAIRTLKDFGAGSAENKRVSRDKLFSAENTYKARVWEFKGLESARLFAEKKAREEKLRTAIASDAKLRQEVGDAWEAIAAAYRKWAPVQKEYYALEGGPRYSDLFRIARNVVRLPVEKAKPNGQRLKEYTDAALPSLELRMYSPAPIADGVEIAVLANYLRFLEEQLGPGNETVKAVLGGRTPEQAAKDYVSSSKLKDVGERKRLAASVEAGKNSEDGMIRLARALDEEARLIRKREEDELDAVRQANATKIALARFAIYGATEYPDATFTLRLSYGPVKGYGKIPYATDFAGMYAHATGEEPFRLPESILKARGALEAKTPLNFVSTCDIIGGNSGSPTVNTRGEVVGIVFDSNLEAMANRFVYGEVEGRAVHVASQGIVEALRKVYHAQRVLDELGFGK
ncbi:MAG: S46 family peptidase [Bryobacteraceae bacterium]